MNTSVVVILIFWFTIISVARSFMSAWVSFVPSQVMLKTRVKTSDCRGNSNSARNSNTLIKNRFACLEDGIGLSEATVELLVSDEIEASTSSIEPLTRRRWQSSKVEIDPLKGNRANVYWRAVSMNDLRLHPLFCSLPDPSEVRILSTKDLGLFQQDSWQWDALHQGRLTTSRLSSILGFYEKNTSTFLGIPESLRGHERVLGAWQHLRQKPPLNWSHLVGSLSHGSAGDSQARRQEQRIWRPETTPNNNSHNFEYHPQRLDSNYQTRYVSTTSAARMAWGSAQEATAVLAMVNYLHKHNSTSTVREAGMFCFEALDEAAVPFSDPREMTLYQRLNHQIYNEQSLPLLGASPDGLIDHGDGSCEVLEVKCFSPFVKNLNRDDSRQSLGISYHRPSDQQEGIPVWHVPQLQMEMLCAGASCTGAIMIVLYVDGAKLYRIPKDEAYQEEMMRWVSRYYSQYNHRGGKRQSPPPHNFFQPQGNKDYKLFLQWTQRIAASATLIATLDSDEVQRSPLNGDFFLD